MEVRLYPDFAFKRAYTNDEGWFEKINFENPYKSIIKLFKLTLSMNEVMYYVKDDNELIYKKIMERIGFTVSSIEKVTPTTFKYTFKKS